MRSILLFSGLGGNEGPPIEQLRAQFARPENAKLFASFVEGVDAALERVGVEQYQRFLPEGLPLRAWLGGARVRAAHSILEGVSAHAYHLCLLQPGSVDLDTVVATVGHSLGLQSAVMAAIRTGSRREYLDLVRRSMILVTLGMLRAHQVTRLVEPDPDLVARYQRTASDRERPAPMACVTGIEVDQLRDMVAVHNAACDVPETLEIALVNSNRFCVLTGGTATLVAFWARNELRLTSPGVRWFYLKATAPFHSSALNRAAELYAHDRDFIAFGREAADLAVPVYTMPVPGNLRCSDDIYRDASRQIICRPQDWRATVLAAVAETEAEQLVDFGPGVAAGMFTRTCLRQAGRSLRYQAFQDRRPALAGSAFG